MAIIDSPPVQRLRLISQTGLAKLVFPGAGHSRFEHSLGVASLLKRIITCFKKNGIIKTVDIDNEVLNNLFIAGILHDVGHVPFSHSTESILKKIDEVKSGLKSCPKGTKPHELMANLLIRNKHFIFRSALEDLGFDPELIAGFIIGKSPDIETQFLADLLCGNIDADRMDYLLRDANQTGLPYGIIDIDRLLHTLDIAPVKWSDITAKRLGKAPKNQIVINEKGAHAAEALLDAKRLLFPALYFHHTVRIAEILLQRLIRTSYGMGLINMGDILTLGDQELLYIIGERAKGKKEYKDILERLNDLKSRRLFKRIVSIGHFNFKEKDQIYTHLLEHFEGDLKNRSLTKDEIQIIANKIEGDISSHFKIDKEDVVVDILDFKQLKESNFAVKCNQGGQLIKLTDYSQLAEYFREKHSFEWGIRIYSSPDISERMRKKRSEVYRLFKQKYNIDLRIIKNSS